MKEHFGRIRILVSNAAEQPPREAVECITPAQVARTFATCVFAQFYLTQAVLPQMETGDSIITVTSVTAYRGPEELIDYSASKGAVLDFTRALAARLDGRGIRVNAIAPGSPRDRRMVRRAGQVLACPDRLLRGDRRAPGPRAGGGDGAGGT